ncbi:MAG: DUF350 domain-containing protein [Thiohalomonadales bacterium]
MLDTILPQATSAIALIVLYVFIILLAKMVNDLTTPYSVDEQLAHHDNLALAISFSGYILATTIIFVAALLGPTQGVVLDIINVGGYSLLGIILLNISRVVNDKLLLHQFSNIEKIINERNYGIGAVQAGSYIASACIIGGALHGEGGGIMTAIVFFVIGQVMLIVVSKVYDFFTPYDIQEELLKNNTAAGIAFSGTLIAVGILLMKGSSGNFISWSYNLGSFALESLMAIIILPVFRLILDKLIIRRIDLNKEIQHDKNIGAGLLEMFVVISFAVVLFFLY